jgi:thiamine-phosphate pyrophosphorylase
VRLPDPPLLLITDRRQAARPLPQIVEAALGVGCRWVSVREKDLPESEQLALAASLRPLTQRLGARLTLHGTMACSEPAVAVLDGIHLPDGADVSLARDWRSKGKLVGRSIHVAAQAGAARGRELDYLIAGPVYESASKPGHGPALGPEGLRAFTRATALPVLAIGGVNADNIGALVQASAAGVAVMGGIMRSSDPAGEARALLDALSAARR